MVSPTTEDAPIEVLPYSETWPALFTAEAALLQITLKHWLVAEIEHVGSTAVAGLCAKPVIDIMAPVKDLPSSIGAIHAVQSLGYCYFPYKPEEMHWFCKPTPATRTHHLHLIPWQSQLWRERIAFREALRLSPVLAQEYSNLKHSLAAKYPRDREAYTAAKAPFVAAVLGSCFPMVRGAA